MESFFSRYRNALVLIAVLLAQVIGLAVQVRAPGQSAGDKGGVRLIRAWVVGVVSPPERLLHATGLGIRGLWANYFDLIHVRQQNKSLQQQLDALRLEEASVAEDARQGERLQALLGFREKYVYKTVAAQVIGTAGTEQSHVLFIDKGSADGIASDMPVITPDGIVGKTRDVFDHTSQVLEISDASSGAGVILQQTRIQGVLRGNSWGQPEIVNVSPDERIKAAEPVVTSGGDSIYPRGLAVGTVDRVVPDPEGTLVSVLVKPSANLEKLEEVLIITSTGNAMPSQMEQDLSDAQQKASDILAERLPSRADPNAPPPQTPAGQNGAPQTPAVPQTALPTPPPKPPPPLHADHFSPAAVPPAEDMVPGQRIANPQAQPAQPSAGADENSGTSAQPRKTANPGVAGGANPSPTKNADSGATGKAATNPAGPAAGHAPANGQKAAPSGNSPANGTKTPPEAKRPASAPKASPNSSQPGSSPSRHPDTAPSAPPQQPASPQGRN